MTSGRAPEPGTGAILRALGSLIAALGDGTVPTGSASVESAALRAAAGELARVERDPGMADAPTEEAALLLADARQRAQRLMDDSMERARELLARGRAGVVNETSESLGRSVQELIHTVHDVQERLDRIESLLRDRLGAARPMREEPERRPAAGAPPAPPWESRAAPASPAAPSGLPTSAVPPIRNAPRPAYSPPPPAAAPSSEPTLRPAPAARVSPASPPPPAESGPPPITPAFARPAVVPPPEPPPLPTPPAPSEGGPIATFTPADGSVVLRATPIAGFQGLMRVQDALARLAPVRQATVEAYAQGEARLRVELDADVDSDEIAAALGEAMGQPARVREADEGDRTMLVVFG